jgi:hypothetical protein
MRPVEANALLPDGAEATVRVGLVDDPYIARKDQQTVGVQIVVDGDVAVSLNTVLEPDDEPAARSLVEQIVRGLESGELEPTAVAVEPLADELR